MPHQNKLGLWGEEIAEGYLKKNGYKILAKNYYTHWGEIDLVGEKEKTLIFFEVKTRKNHRFGLPEEAFDFYKRKRLRRAVYYYLKKMGLGYQNFQVDLLAIEIKDNEPQVRHLENILDEI